jgi:RNA polymerase sigma factor (sigma-70 family)
MVMANARSSHLLQQVGRLFGAGASGGLTDAQLLERFTSRCAASAEARGDAEAAFEVLVARHGPMVLGVCRRALTDPAEVEDAFQATFLVLVRRARSVRVDDSLGRWLYGVACRVAAKARSRSRRIPIHNVDLVAEPEVSERPVDRASLLAALDEEIGRLPERYRSPVVLCHLEGLSHAEAADRLRCPVGTVSGRLSRARGLLRDRLVRRGCSPTAGAIALLSVPEAARAAMPECLAAMTAHAAMRFAASGTTAVGVASSSAVALMNDALRAAVAFKLKVGAAVLLAVATTALAVPGVIAGARPGGGDPDVAPSPPVVGARVEAEAERPAHYRPADEIVKELEARLARSRRSLPEQEFYQLHNEIAALVLELRIAYPDDPRGARRMLDRWHSLGCIQRTPEAIDECQSLFRSTNDRELKADAAYYQWSVLQHEPFDGPVVMEDLASSFARETSGDRTAARLQTAGWIRLGMALILGAACLPLLMTRRSWRYLGRPGLAVLAVSAAAILCVRLATDDKLSRASLTSIEEIHDIELRNQARARVISDLMHIVEPDVEGVLLIRRAGLVFGLTLVAASALIAVRLRRAEGRASRLSIVRTSVLGFVGSLALLCVADAGLLFVQRGRLSDQIVRDHPDSFSGRIIQGERRRRDRVGEPFELEFDDAISGRRVAMKDLRGKVVVIDFWATWCRPCVKEIPEMLRLYETYHDRGVEFIGVSLDRPEADGGLDALKKFVAERKIAWPQYYQGHDNHRVMTGEPVGDFSESWGISDIPTVFLIDAEGKLYSTEARGQLDVLIPRLLDRREDHR